jgi:integrase
MILDNVLFNCLISVSYCLMSSHAVSVITNVYCYPGATPMAKSKQLTAAYVERVKPPASGRVEHFDTLVPGLGLRVTERGHKSWSFTYRIDGRSRRLTLGKYPAIALPEARQQAREARLAVDRGTDPALRREQALALATRLRQRTVCTVFDQFDTRYMARHNTEPIRKVTRSFFERFVFPAWADLPLGAVSRQDVIALVNGVLDDRPEHPHAANHVLKHVRRFFGWAVDQGYIAENPAFNVGLPVPEPARDRVLSDQEIPLVWTASKSMGYPFGDLYRLLLLTGQRRGEAAKLRWSHLDLQAAMWTIPRDLSKSDRAHRVPLSSQAINLIHSLPSFAGPFVFSTTKGTKPVSGFSKAKLQLDELCGLSDFRIHDFRRTATSRMASLDVPPHVLSRILNHARARMEGATAVYNVYGYEREKRSALQAWSDYVQNLTGTC